MAVEAAIESETAFYRFIRLSYFRLAQNDGFIGVDRMILSQGILKMVCILNHK